MPVLKGALVSFDSSGGVLGLPSIPNVIVFQINPETITHGWIEASSPQPSGDPRIHISPLAVTGTPGETFQFTLMLDSDEQIADAATDPVSASLAAASGVYTRLAALEMLQFPSSAPSQELTGQVSAAASAAAAGQSASGSSAQNIPIYQLPIVLFVYGPSRVVPVRVTAFSVTEKLYDELLNPTHAEAAITLTVLTPADLAPINNTVSKVAQAAYNYTQGVREAFAAANLGESAASLLGMLPIPM